MHSTMTSEAKEEVLLQASREAHHRRQAAVFDSKVAFFSSPQATPKEQFPSLRRIAEACRPVEDTAARVVDAGCGTGALVDFLKEAGVEEGDVTGVDLSPEMGIVFKERFPKSEIITAEFVNYADEVVALRQRLAAAAAAAVAAAAKRAEEEGDERATATAEEDRKDEGDEQRARGVGTVVFNSVFGNLWDQGAALERAAAILEERGKVVISHPLGRDFVSRLKAVDDTVVPHDLPEMDELERLVRFQPFVIESFESGPELYLAVLRKAPHRASEIVRYLRGTVSTGYGRGSKKLGVPTANLPESQFAENLRSLATGVYFGWAALEGAGEDAEDGGEGAAKGGGDGPWKCVANVGYSPTFAGQENAEKIVEGHLIGYKGEDFYGRTMRMLLAGFQRREKKFASFPELVATINKDVGDAAAALDEPRFSVFKADPFFSQKEDAAAARTEAWSTRDFQGAKENATGAAENQRHDRRSTPGGRHLREEYKPSKTTENQQIKRMLYTQLTRNALSDSSRRKHQTSPYPLPFSHIGRAQEHLNPGWRYFSAEAMVVIEQSGFESEPVEKTGFRLVGRKWGAIGRPAATESEAAAGSHRRATSVFDSGIGMRDVQRRDRLERKYGRAVSVDPTVFLPTESPVATAAATPEQPPLDLWALLGTDTGGGGSGGGGGWDGDDDATSSTAWSSPPGPSKHATGSRGGPSLGTGAGWSDMFRDAMAAAAAAIAPDTPPSPGVAAPAGSSGAIGGQVFDADSRRAAPSPMFAEVGKPSVEAASRNGGDYADVPTAGGGGGGVAYGGGGSGDLGGGPSSHHGFNDDVTAIMVRPDQARIEEGEEEEEMVDREFHGLFGSTGGKDPIAQYFSARANRRVSAAERAGGAGTDLSAAAAAAAAAAVEETNSGGGSSKSAGGGGGGRAPGDSTQKCARPKAAAANAVFGVENGVWPIAIGGGGGVGGKSSSLSTAPGQDLGDTHWPDAGGWLLPEACESTMSGAETWAEVGRASGAGSAGEVVHDDGSWGEPYYLSGEAPHTLSTGDGGGRTSLLGDNGRESKAVTATVAWERGAPKTLLSNEFLGVAASSGRTQNSSGGAVMVARGGDGGDSPLRDDNPVFTRAVPGADDGNVTLNGGGSGSDDDGGGGGGGGGGGDLWSTTSRAGEEDDQVFSGDSTSRLFSMADDAEVSDEVVVAAENEEATEASPLEEAIEASAPYGEFEGPGGDPGASTAAEEAPVGGVSRRNSFKPERPPASGRTVPNAEAAASGATRDDDGGDGCGGGGISGRATQQAMDQPYDDVDLEHSVGWLFGGEYDHLIASDGGGGAGVFAASETAPFATGSTSSWLGSAAGLVRATTAAIAVALSSSGGIHKEKKIRGWRSPPQRENRRLLGAYPDVFPCRTRGVRGELRAVRQKKRSPAAHYAIFWRGRWAHRRDETLPWATQLIMRHVWAESHTPRV
eukprot:g2424.t1